MGMTHRSIPASVATAVIAATLVTGCEPSKPKPVSSTTPPIETRKTIGKTTQNIMPLADALKQGGQPAEMSITEGGLGAITSDAYRTIVGKIGIMAVEHQMQLVEAEHGPKPMGYDEFMTRVIGKGKPDGDEEARRRRVPPQERTAAAGDDWGFGAVIALAWFVW